MRRDTPITPVTGAGAYQFMPASHGRNARWCVDGVVHEVLVVPDPGARAGITTKSRSDGSRLFVVVVTYATVSPERFEHILVLLKQWGFTLPRSRVRSMRYVPHPAFADVPAERKSAGVRIPWRVALFLGWMVLVVWCLVSR